MEQILNTLRDSKRRDGLRWYLYQCRCLVHTFLIMPFHLWNDAWKCFRMEQLDFGIYTSSLHVFNVFLFMLIFSELYSIKWEWFYRLLHLHDGNWTDLITGRSDIYSLMSYDFWNKNSVIISAIGFGIFGVGTEAGGITVSKAVVKWFKGREMALAMGMQMSIARLAQLLPLE